MFSTTRSKTAINKKVMKKLLFGLVTTLMFGFLGNAQSLEESTVLISKGSILKNKMYARTIEVKSFDTNLKMEQTLALDFNDFTDDGKNNDLTAGDGIYTSVKLFSADDFKTNYIFKSDLFKYQKELDSYLNSNTSKFGGEFGCKIRQVHSGTTVIFGTDCSTHWCVELYDCSFKLKWD